MNWQEILDGLIKTATSFGIKLLGAVLVLVISLKVIRRIKKWFRKSPKLDKMDPGVRSFLSSFISIGLSVLMVIILIGMLGVPATSLVTVLASCGVAIGLALQGSLSNVAGGVMILLFRPFKVGDFIDVDGDCGTVAEITVVYTILLTPDNKRITIPNGTITNTTIENYSAEKLRRVDLDFNTAVDCDVDQVRGLLDKLARSHPMVLMDPEPFIRMSAHTPRALIFKVRVWCKNEDYWDVHFDLTESVEKAFADNGIKVPHPQVDIHVKNDK